VTVTIDTGTSSVQVVDWMGNASTVATPGGSLTLSLTNEPTYVKGVASSLWGSARSSTNVALGKTVTTSSDATTDGGAQASGSLAVDGDMWANESRWISTSDDSDKWIAVNLGAATSIDEVRFFTGEYDPGAHANTYGDAVPSYHVQQWTGSAWADVGANASNTRAAVDVTFAPVTTTQLRLYFDANGATSQVKLYEVEVLTTPGPGGTVDGGAAASDAGAPAADGGGTSTSSGGVDKDGGAIGRGASSNGSGHGKGSATARSTGGAAADASADEANDAASDGGGCAIERSASPTGGTLWFVGALASVVFVRRRSREGRRSEK
jgi:hypothetical protein